MRRFASTSITFLALLEVAVGEIALQRRVSHAPKRKEAANIPAADFYVSIVDTTPRSNAKKTLMKNFTASAAGSDLDEEYLVNVTIGGQPFSIQIDTGR